MGRQGVLNLAFIGLGAMGAPMASSLLAAGHALKAYDTRRTAVDELLGKGALWAESARAAAHGAEVVFTCLPGPNEVEVVAADLLDAMAEGSAWFDLSTNSPDRVRRLGERCAVRGVQLLDAP